MIRNSILTAILVWICAAAHAAAAEPRILSERFDDWFYRCVNSEGENGEKQVRCEVVQIAQTRQGEETINLLTLSLSETTEKGRKAPVLTVLAPLNVYLPAGVALSIDQGESVALSYRNCNKAGCWFQHRLTDSFLTRLKGGQTGFAKFRLINGQNLNIKFSLKGITAALQALQALQNGKQPEEKS